jgi:hypothetical protein
MKIRSISDAITNSSNETFITTHKPDPEVYDYSYAEKLTWENIINYGTYDFSPDLMVYILEERLLDHKLLQNPFPRTKENDTPWQQAEYCGWTEEELKDIWVLFIELNKEDFKELVGLCYVSGPEDNQYDDYDQWVSNNEDLSDISILRAGRDQDFF